MAKMIDVLEAKNLLLEAQRLVVAGHINPDGDTLGSSLALIAGLRQLGKKVTFLVDDQIGSIYSFLPGIADCAKSAEALTADLLVVVDASSLDRIGGIANCVKAPIINIDHHISNTGFADYLWLDADATAVGEMMFELLQVLQVKMDKDIGTCLYAAIATDCGFFKYSNTSAKAMRAAAELLELGVEPNVVSDCLEMKSRDNLALLTKVLSTLTFLDDGTISYIEIPYGEYNKDIDTDSFMQYPRYVEGVEVALMFKGTAAAATRVSMRSRNIDVSKIALALGGGGHKRAAGCTVNDELAKAKEIVLAKVRQEMEAMP